MVNANFHLPRLSPQVQVQDTNQDTPLDRCGSKPDNHYSPNGKWASWCSYYRHSRLRRQDQLDEEMVSQTFIEAADDSNVHMRSLRRTSSIIPAPAIWQHLPNKPCTLSHPHRPHHYHYHYHCHQREWQVPQRRKSLLSRRKERPSHHPRESMHSQIEISHHDAGRPCAR
jgi:hypothetical protein